MKYETKGVGVKKKYVHPPRKLSFRSDYTLKLNLFHKNSSMVQRKPWSGLVLSNETSLYPLSRGGVRASKRGVPCTRGHQKDIETGSS